MVTEINGDLLLIKSGILCHQVNCKGVMGAGIALAIKRSFPSVYTSYMAAFKRGDLKLGYTLFVGIDSGYDGYNRIFANLCGQDGYGRTGVYTDYAALRQCLTDVQKVEEYSRLPVYIPRGMGCSLAGGDWNIVSQIIAETVPNAIIVNYNQPSTWRRN